MIIDLTPPPPLLVVRCTSKIFISKLFKGWYFWTCHVHKRIIRRAYFIKRRHRLSSRASRSSEHVISPTSSLSKTAPDLAFSAASFIRSHSELVLWMTLAYNEKKFKNNSFSHQSNIDKCNRRQPEEFELLAILQIHSQGVLIVSPFLKMKTWPQQQLL